MKKITQGKAKYRLPAHARLVKKHFPTFYDKPIFAVIILLGLVSAFWLLR